MALATKCSQCGALFRVVADQLKLRGGLVRCGQCRAVFDAIGSLTYVDDAAIAPAPTVVAATQPMTKKAAPPSPPRSEPVTRVRHGPRTRPARPAPATTISKALGPTTTLRIAPTAPATLANPALRRSAPLPDAKAEKNPERTADEARRRARIKRDKEIQEQAQSDTGVPTLIAPGGRERIEAGSIVDGIEVIELAPLPEQPETRPSRSESEKKTREAAVEPEPEFIRSKKRRERRGFSIIFGGGSALLIALAIAQFAVIFRSELIARAPQLRNPLVALCGVFGCTVGWPTQVDQLAVIGSELQAIPGTDVLELTAVIRNRATFRQALPALEVTLTDSRNRPVARKVFSPADYLAAAGEPSSRIGDGLAAGADHTIRIFFEARGVQAAGFLVYPFFI